MEQETYTGYAVLVWDRVARRAWFVGRRAGVDQTCADVDMLYRDALRAQRSVYLGVHVRDNVVTWCTADSWSDARGESGWGILSQLVAAGEAWDVCHGPATYNHADIVLPFHLLNHRASQERYYSLSVQERHEMPCGECGTRGGCAHFAA